MSRKLVARRLTYLGVAVGMFLAGWIVKAIPRPRSLILEAIKAVVGGYLVLGASIPALLALIGGLLWMKERRRPTA